jgi:hypothetical protein
MRAHGVGGARIDEPTMLQVALLKFGLSLKDAFNGLVRNDIGYEHLNGFVRVVQVGVSSSDLGRGIARQAFGHVLR